MRIPGSHDYGDSIEKISPKGAVLDYFTPYNQATLNAGDLDLGSGGVLLLPNPSGSTPLLVMAGKEGTIYLVDRDNMGHYNANNDDQIVQSLPNVLPGDTADSGNFSAPVYFNGSVYFGAVNDAVKSFQLSNGLLSTSPTSQSAQSYGGHGETLALSANGNANGILWAVEDNGYSAPGVLYAYDADNLNNELYDSNQAGSRDTLGAAAKFSVPLVANGMVYVAGASQLTVYGLLPSP